MNCLVSKMGPGERQERKELKEEGHQSLACMLKDIEGRLDQVADAERCRIRKTPLVDRKAGDGWRMLGGGG